MSVIKNEKVFVEVGSTCLQDFLCSDKVSGIVWMANFTQTVGDILSSGREATGRTTPVYELATVLGCALKSVRENGYINRDKAQELETCSTAGEAMYLMNGDRYANIAPYEPTEAELDEANLIIGYIQGITTETDYKYNLQKIACSEFVTGRFVGYAVSMIPFYRKAMNMIKERTNTKASDHVGNVGEKIVTDVTFVSVHVFDTQFGTMFINKFLDANGDMIIWKTGKCDEFATNKKYLVSAKVKEHNDYKGTKQTIITYPKFKEI